MFADWEEKPTVLNVFRVGKPNSHGRKTVRILLETEKDAAMILEQNGKRVIHKDHGFWLHVYGEKVTPAVLHTKRELESCEGVSKVYFDGPVRMFTVKMTDGNLKRRITNVKQLSR